ncbi:MAG: extracellular solute-binding protein, partial [Christensenellaceae bacterium]|nr:extracellular solute-binding protein [Christensenellaceae bacterium]
FPEGFESVTNENGPDMLALGRAVMLIDGSWQSGLLKDTNWGAFAIPAPEGREPGICFHPDMGLAGNNATQYPEEVKAFLAWIASPEGAEKVAAALPGGFFPMIDAPIELTDPKVNEVLAANQGRTSDARFFWNKLMPMYKFIVEELNALAKGEKSVADVAEAFAVEQEKVLAQ